MGEEQLDHVWQVVAGSPRERCRTVIFVQEVPHTLKIAERRREDQIVRCPALEEQPGGLDVPPNAPERAVPERHYIQKREIQPVPIFVERGLDSWLSSEVLGRRSREFRPLLIQESSLSFAGGGPRH